MTIKTGVLGLSWLAICMGLIYLDSRLTSIAIFSMMFLGIRGLVAWLSHRYIAAYRNNEMDLKTRENKLLWCNTAVSLIHSCISSGLSFYVYVADPADDWIHSCSPMATICLALSTGYFIYDFYDMVDGNLWFRAVGILVHHVMVVTCYVSALYYRIAVPYLVVMLLLEMNSVCLHTRKLMSMIGFTLHDKFYVVTWQALWLTFYTTRLLLPLAVHIGVYSDRERFPHFAQFSIAFLGTAILHVLNYLVYQGCCKAYRKELKQILDGKKTC